MRTRSSLPRTSMLGAMTHSCLLAASARIWRSEQQNAGAPPVMRTDRASTRDPARRRSREHPACCAGDVSAESLSAGREEVASAARLSTVTVGSKSTCAPRLGSTPWGRRRRPRAERDRAGAFLSADSSGTSARAPPARRTRIPTAASASATASEHDDAVHPCIPDVAVLDLESPADLVDRRTVVRVGNAGRGRSRRRFSPRARHGPAAPTPSLLKSGLQGWSRVMRCPCSCVTCRRRAGT